MSTGEGAFRNKLRWVFRPIAPYAGALGALLLVSAVLVTMYLSLHDWQWMTFFSGILMAAVLSLASRSVHAQWLIARRNVQLSQAQQKLATENRLRVRAEQELSGIENNINYLHDSLPAMLAYVDDRHQLKYHNHAFRHGLGATASHIDGRHLRDVIGKIVYAELERDLDRAFGGNTAHREHLQQSTAGETFRFLMQCLPQFGASGEVVGVFLISTDITGPQDFALPPFLPASSEPKVSVPDFRVPPPVIEHREAPVEGQDDDEALLRHALEHDGFCLFFQTIESIGAGPKTPPFREILLRLKMEEESMIPPGSFLPAAEQFGMLPDLDRWVVRHVLDWLGADAARQQATFSINVSSQTLADHEFPGFVKKALRDSSLPGTLLCFELQEADIIEQGEGAAHFVEQLQQAGCRCAICGFNGSRVSFDLLRQVPVNFLKIEGSLILNSGRSAVDQARVKAIQRVALAIGVSTIAEHVEDDETLEWLRTIGVDYAQGFGISRPQSLQQLASDEYAGHAGSRHALASRHNDTDAEIAAE